nr:ATP-binding protein [Ancylobacter sp. Lp-2]
MLVAALLLVSVVATTLSFLLLTPPRFDEIEDAVASQWALVADLVAHGNVPVPMSDRVIGVHAQPPSGEVLEAPTHGINAALATRGRPERIAVYKAPEASWPVLAGRLADGRWLWLPLAAPPEPRNQHWALFGWVLAMLIGTTLVMLIAVRRLTAPLALLERTVATIGPGGEISPLAENGPEEVRAAARAINLLASRLKQAMESRIRLVAAAGHDLRTPMTRMRLRAEFLPDEDRDIWIGDLDELNRIADSAIQLVREEVEGSTRSPIRLDTLVRDVTDELREVGLAIRLDSTVEVSIQARPLSLRRAIRNLTINAATHGGGAHIAVSSAEGEARVTISDRGPGIPEALMGQVFEPFFRVDPARGAEIPGAGLGLAIAREIAIGNGGRLILQNRPEGGLVQHLSFPAASPT